MTSAPSRAECGVSDVSNQDSDRSRIPAREQVFRLVGEYDLFADADRTAYMSLPATHAGVSCQEVYAIRSSAARSRLAALYRDTYGNLVTSQALKEGIDSLEAEARQATISVGLRTMLFDKGFALDLGDRSWTRVVVSPGSWITTNETRPRFRREAGMLALPRPIPGGDIRKLRRFLNVSDDDSFSLLLGWLVYALQPKGPYPILELQGEHGTCKSTAARIIDSLIDPNLAPLIGIPKSERDLMVIARSRHLLAFDNASGLGPDIRDALCRLATGGGYASRKLYSDSDTVVWNVCRPIVINGIDSLLVADDLADRAIGLTLPYIPEDQRMRESDLMREFEAVRFEILGAALDAAAHAVASPTVPADSHLSRMADFAHFAASAASAWGVTYQEFLDQYRRNRQKAIERGLDTDIVARAIRWLLTSDSHWQGNIGELLVAIRSAPDLQDMSESFPATARGLGARLRRLAPALRAVGIVHTELGRIGSGFQVRLERASAPGDVRSVRCVRSSLLNEERKKREVKEGIQHTQRAQRTPPGDPSDRGGES